MKKPLAVVAALLLAVVAVRPMAAPPDPPFDGNVASVVWGARVESITGATPQGPSVKSPDAARVMLMPPYPGKTAFGMQNAGPTDVVISFFKHDTASIKSVSILSKPQVSGLKDVEVWASSNPTAAADTFTKLASGSLPLESNPFARPEITLTFDPVQARFVKIRLMSSHGGFGTGVAIHEIKVLEAAAPGYVSLVARHPEIAEPAFMAEATKALAAQPPVAATCKPAATTPLQPGNGESRKVLLVTSNYLNVAAGYIPFRIKTGSLPTTHTSKSEELRIFDRLETTLVVSDHAQPWMLADVDTVLMEQACDLRVMSERFKKALVAWVAAGHKLIIHDSDKCSDPKVMNYASWLPYKFTSDNPGALGKPGAALKVVENNWMAHTQRGRRGFVDAAAWVALSPPANELGDSNAVMEWGPGWCGNMVVRNANGIFGFVASYARHGRGLIIWDGLDVDMTSSKWMDIVHAQQLAQGFNADNLPCSVRIGSFAVTTEPRLVSRGVQPGQTYTYPLSLLSNIGYKGTVTLSAVPAANAPDVKPRFEPATVDVSSLQESTLTVTVPPGRAVQPFALEVKGTAADGKTNSLCLELGPVKAGELSVVSTLAPPTKTRKNLEIILDASGSMKTLLGKTSRWAVALETLDQALNGLPDDFSVGLRMYGHREPSTSPKTCTDSELVIPIRKLDRKAIIARASAFKPKGETPLVYSALQAPADLKAVGGGTVILITDGEESCKGDPVAAAAALKASGLDIRLNIVGFAIKNPKTQKDLAGFAQATGGLFYAAQSGATLGDALMLAAIEKFPYTVYDAAGKTVLSSEAGSGSDELPPGTYKVVVKAGSKELIAPRVSVALGQQVTLTIAMKNGQLVLQ
ncbi:MAG: hypothetical protein A3H96_26430 [Acidobacteria bacterium RIFCSPLOWO2_02_FULL_67_36]|nr:MAG: hypothetical protein A3H96_26430 [Acidobacteria bacterium RIFCSPLOWO2_02_FULL_67_36]OFW22350.1 MAG: hypothetical protein A3G21_15420 [Acidobacteria bacterium RIFCSPLOWO2_12_FULL_66_21]